MYDVNYSALLQNILKSNATDFDGMTTPKIYWTIDNSKLIYDIIIQIYDLGGFPNVDVVFPPKDFGQDGLSMSE